MRRRRWPSNALAEASGEEGSALGKWTDYEADFPAAVTQH